MNFATALQGLVGILWLVVVGMVVLAIIRAARAQNVKSLTSAILVTAIIALLLTTVSAGLVFVPPDQRGVVISALEPQGYREQALQPGLRWIIPYFENVVMYPISRQTYTMSIASIEGQVQGDDSVAARTSDGQEVFLDASVIYAIDPDQVVRLHIAWQKRYTDELVRPLSRGVMRDAVSQFGVEEVYSTRRLEMTQQIRDDLSAKLQDNGLLLVDFILRNITFSPEYAASVEQKQIAEQQAQQARFVVEQRKQEAQQAIETAKGQAESVKIKAQGDADARLIQAKAETEALQMIAQALKERPELLTYQYITHLAPSIQTMLLPSNNPFLLPLPTQQPSAAGTPTLSPTPIFTPTLSP
ncbi:MAG: SPFH domain-containing protein [Anaerolineales bacterium]|nr:SPFH domain-containing protein [Anaerolineales bacterium]